MVEAVVVILSLQSHNLLATGHFVPARQFATVQSCMDWLDGQQGDHEWRELGEEYRGLYVTKVNVVPACLKANEA
jgi:hypothetical protein